MGNKRLHSPWNTVFLLGFLLTYTGAFSQYNFVLRQNVTPTVDTLFLSHRSGGKHIDSLDKAYYDAYLTLFNVGRGFLPQFRDLQTWGTYRHHFADERPVYRAAYHFTALPYTGFFYSFGSGGEQVLDLRYSQNVGQNFNLSFRYHRTTSDMMRNNFLMRNIETQTNDVSLNLHYHKKRLNSFFSSYYSFDNYRENFGINASWQVVHQFPLEQIPVVNSEASVNVKRMQFNWRNEYAMLEGLNRMSYVLNVGVHNFQRRYRDTVQFGGTLNYWIYDSTNTNDLWEEPHLLVENGLQFSNAHWKIYGGFHLDYFSYFNRGYRFNHLDGILQGESMYKSEKLVWNNNLRFFIFGTPGEYLLRSNVMYQLTDKLCYGASARSERTYPEIFQLYFDGNHINYNNLSTEITPTQRTYLEASLAYGKENKVKLSGAFLGVQNLYIFQTNQWVYDANQAVFAPELAFQLRKGIVAFQGRGQYFLGSKSDFFAPDYFASSRLYIDAALFKAKRLKLATGVEVQYFDGYSPMAYHPELGIFGRPSATQAFPRQNMLLNVFVNLQMDRFRMFVAANRINTLFESTRGSLVEHYPIRPFYIRIGITWDFVN